MRIVESVCEFERKGCVLSIGNFDGVHIGHREILSVAKETAAERGVELVVMTFEPHPVMVLQPNQALGVLTPMPLKKSLLEECGADCLVVLDCSIELLALSARDFVNRFLINSLAPGVVVEGENFHFGSGRGGSVDTMRQLGAEAGFEVVVVAPKMAQTSSGRTVRVSSTLIRHLLQAGMVADAAAALGRSYRLYGQVTAGRGRGKILGFPTANIEPAEQIIPAEAVYAGFVAITDSCEEVCRADAKQPAALSIGRSSTYGDDNPLLVEAHILEGKVGELRDKFLAMDFVGRIRDQKKFETEKDLAKQIAKDCKKAKDILTAGQV